MRWIFTTSAALTIFALGTIILFLVKESVSFFPEYQESLESYRHSGLEYVDLLEERYRDFIEIDHQLIEIRARWINHANKTREDSSATIALDEHPINHVFLRYRASGQRSRDYIDRILAKALSTRDALTREKGPTDFAAIRQSFIASLDEYIAIQNELEHATRSLFAEAETAKINLPGLDRQFAFAADANDSFHRELALHIEDLRAWDPAEPLRKNQAVGAFIFGNQWTTSNQQQDWYGLLPLLTGSLLITLTAISIATPLGVGAAVYVNQLASAREQALLKPTIEFISALPAVAIGFFGVMVFGDFVREISRSEWLQWVGFFQVQERLNAFTAGCLLALMAVPTIFTLTEDALYAVRNEIKEASYSIGATKLQTAFRVILPSALPGIISAILLAFGRVVGETMIVLLCAGNRVKIPEFSEGLAAIFDPVHTMTGMIAQEMGEVVYGDIHYQALFMVGLILFTISLIINYGAETLANRHYSMQERYRKRG